WKVQRDTDGGIKALAGSNVERLGAIDLQTDHLPAVVAVEQHITRCVGDGQRGGLRGSQVAAAQIVEVDQQTVGQSADVLTGNQGDIATDNVRISRANRGA